MWDVEWMGRVCIHTKFNARVANKDAEDDCKHGSDEAPLASISGALHSELAHGSVAVRQHARRHLGHHLVSDGPEG